MFANWLPMAQVGIEFEKEPSLYVTEKLDCLFIVSVIKIEVCKYQPIQFDFWENLPNIHQFLIFYHIFDAKKP